jgi:5-methylcytosine-specific restriction endonuclease McrA
MASSKVHQATALRASGLLWREVAERMNVSVSYAHQLASDPANFKRNARRRGPQTDKCACGTRIVQPTGSGTRRLYCASCRAQRKRDAQRQRWNATKDIRNARRRDPAGTLAQNKAQQHRSRGASTRPEFLTALFFDPCSYCGGTSGHGIDHIIPINVGGGGEAENLTAACFRCNRRKSDTSLLLFLAKRAEA